MLAIVSVGLILIQSKKRKKIRMKIFKEELLTEEEVEDMMQVKAEEREEAQSFADDIFNDAGFEKSLTANNITYTQEGTAYKALFTIDNTSFNYKCYVTTEGSNSSTFSAQGDINGIKDAAYKFLTAVDDAQEEEKE